MKSEVDSKYIGNKIKDDVVCNQYPGKGKISRRISRLLLEGLHRAILVDRYNPALRWVRNLIDAHGCDLLLLTMEFQHPGEINVCKNVTVKNQEIVLFVGPSSNCEERHAAPEHPIIV